MLIKPIALFNRLLCGIQFDIIVCHEGLPRSGKSYEALVNQIIPALLKGRKVFAYLKGLDHEKIADVIEKPLDIVKGLLIQVTKEQVYVIHSIVEDDSLVVIDELQDFFPSYERKMTPEITEFVTQHGHRGIDIVVMGQAKEDFNILWRRRIDTSIYFIKRDAVGDYSSYTWITYKQNKGKFVKVRNGKGKYDAKYFGLYASHNDGVEAIDTHVDDRVNILKSSAFKIWLPLFGVLLLFAIYYLYSVFHDGNGFAKNSPPKVPPVVQSVPQSPVVQSVPQPPVVQPVPPKPLESKPLDKVIDPLDLPQQQLNTYKGFLDIYFKKYRPRLAAYVHAKATPEKPERFYAEIQFFDTDNKLQDSFNIPQLTELGYTFRHSSLGLIVKGGGGEYVVKAWQLLGCNGKECDRVGQRSGRDSKDKT